MTHTTIIIKKEIKEMLTPGSVASVLLMVVLFAGMGGLIGGEVEKAATLPEFGIVAEDSYEFDLRLSDGTTERIVWNPLDYLRDVYSSESDKITVLTGDDLISEMNAQGITNAIVLPDAQTFERMMESHEQAEIRQYYIYEPTGMFGSVSSTVMGTIVSYLNADLSKLMIEKGDLSNYEFVITPLSTPKDSVNTVVNGESYSGISPYDISNEINSQTMMIPLVIMIIITMIGSMVISSMGNEKENKTLETLLTLPIKRTSIVGGKILAAAIVGLVYGVVYMIGMSFYMNSLMGSASGASSVDLASIGMSLDLMDWILVAISMFMAIVCALGMCMVLGAFSKNYKSAQTMTLPLSIMALVPMFVIMFTGWYGCGSALQGICFVIPFSHPMMAMQALMNGDIMLVASGIAYMAAFAIAMILITVRIYNSDILITGLGQNKWVQKLTKSR